MLDGWAGLQSGVMDISEYFDNPVALPEDCSTAVHCTKYLFSGAIAFNIKGAIADEIKYHWSGQSFFRFS